MDGQRRWLATSRVLGVCLSLSFVCARVDAQESARVAVTVDYVGVEGVYLALGIEQGVQAGDTLIVFATELAEVPLGSVLFTTAARRRSVASMLDPAFEVAQGDLLYVSLPTATAVDDPAAAPVAAVRVATPRAHARTSNDQGPRVSGRVSLEFDARETRTTWEGDLFGTTIRRFATPVSSVSLTIADLPGGFRVETNLRGSYRYSDVASIQPAASVRVYNLSVVKMFDAAPIELRMGRFYNPHESYSAYWDGMLMRLGGRSGPGLGVAAGFEPNRANEGFSQDVTKITAFADFAARGRSWRYDSDASFHVLQESADSLADRSFAGWSQQLTIGSVSFSQRLRLDRDVDASTWSLSQLRLRAGIALGGGFRVNGGYGRTRPSSLRGQFAPFSPEREEVTAGISMIGNSGSLGLDVGSTRRTDAGRGISVAASATGRMGGVLLFASGRRWSRTGMSSVSAAPGFGFGWRWLDTRVGYQFYRTESTTTLTSQSADLNFTARVSQGLSVTLRGQQQWGSNFEGTRVQVRIWRSF